MHAANAAITRKFVLIVKTSKAEMPITIYFPTTGISAIHIAAIIIRP